MNGLWWWLSSVLLGVLLSSGVTAVAQPTEADYSTQIHTLFIGYFGRPPGPSGLSYYEGQMADSDGNYLILIDDFWNSAERDEVYGELSREAQVTAVFNQLFGRAPQAEGLAYWVGETISVGEMVYTIAYNAQAADSAVLEARLRSRGR
jgi:hypothetical protein